MATISPAFREFVIHRAKGLCEYCQTPMVIVIEMEIDHIKPESLGGETTPENSCLACISCNSHKRDSITAVGPQTGQVVPLFNPRLQIWDEHFRWSEDGTLLIGLTSIGRATIARLKINREVVVNARQRWVKAGWHPPTQN